MADTVQDYTKKWCAPICLDVPCTYTTQRKHQTKGVSICPHTFGCPHVWMPPCMFGCPHMFGCPCMFGCSLCLNAPCMFGQPQCLDAPIYLDDVWLPPVHTQHKERILCQTKEVSTCPHTSRCPLYINNIKKACFVRLRGCPYAPIDLDATICLDTTCMLGCHLYV